MAKTKLVYDDERVEQLSFKDGFSTGFEACKDGIVNWRGRMGLNLYWFVILLIFCIPLVGQVIALLRLQNAYAGGIRYEQLLLAGRSPGYKDAWAVFVADRGLTKFSVMTLGIMFGAQVLAGVLGSISLGGGLLALVAVLVVSPVLTGAVTLAAWSMAIQGSDGKVAMDKFPQIVKKGWSALAGQLVVMWLVMFATVVLTIIAGVIMAFFMGASVGIFSGGAGVGAGVGIAAAVLMTLSIVLVGSVAVIPLFGLGFHLLGRKMMMKSVEVVEVVKVRDNPLAGHIPLPGEDHS